MPPADPLAASLPDIPTLRRRSQSIALLDAILSPDWEYRYYSFNAAWAAGEQMASMRNGEGDWYFIWFSPAGAVIKGFDQESPLAVSHADDHPAHPGVLDGLPPGLAPFLTEPAFFENEGTYCLWRTPADPHWLRGPVAADPEADGSLDQLRLLLGDPADYVEWAGGYYEVGVPRAAVDHVYAHRPLTEGVVRALNPGVTIADLAEDVAEIGYPL